ncbi:MAG TPA: hypothetical protein VJ690_09330 [Burkholderiales bacterium]|nr:hypothetical protein [Burkholderiales bacterium]
MKRLALLLCMLVAPGLAAQEPPKKKKAQAKKQQIAHKKPTPEQIRKFKELEKKQKRS